jgi:hypothetical protein
MCYWFEGDDHVQKLQHGAFDAFFKRTPCFTQVVSVYSLADGLRVKLAIISNAHRSAFSVYLEIVRQITFQKEKHHSNNV